MRDGRAGMPVASSERLRIVFLVRSLDYGGAERQVVETCRGLTRLGCRVAVGVFYPGGGLEREIEGAGVTILTLGKKGRWDVFGFLVRTARILRRERPDVVYSYMTVPNLIAVLLRPLLRRVRIVWSVRDSGVDYRRYHWLYRIAFSLSGRLGGFADAIVVNSEAGRCFHAAHGYPEARMTLIPNGIDTERFRPDRALGCALRSAWGVDAGKRLVGLVGRLDPMKDHATFLRAAARLVALLPDVRFVCVGGGLEAYGRELRDLATTLGLSERLIWAGAQADMPAVYNALDVLVLSSSFGEGFPNAVGEAMACALPCAVTDVGDCRRVVGETGLVVPPGDAGALAAALREILSDPGSRRRGQAARRRVVEEFSGPRMVSETLGVLHRTTARG